MSALPGELVRSKGRDEICVGIREVVVGLSREESGVRAVEAAAACQGG